MDPAQPGSLPPPAPPPGAPPPPAAPSAETTETTAKLVYILYLVSLAVGVTAIVGVILAYVNQGDAPPGLATHYRYQIRTFWLGLLYALVGTILSLVGIGVVILLFVVVWLVVRCAKGLRWLDRREPVTDPAAWLW